MTIWALYTNIDGYHEDITLHATEAEALRTLGLALVDMLERDELDQADLIIPDDLVACRGWCDEHAAETRTRFHLERIDYQPQEQLPL